MRLDQFYTKTSVARSCYESMLPILGKLDSKTPFFVEPSAGSGSFFDILDPKRRLGIDIEPQARGIKKHDFLTWDYRKLSGKKDIVVIGNPPFGKRSKLAIDFFNRAALFAPTIGFIVPVQFKKYSVHSKLPKEYKLIIERSLERDSFVTADGKDFNVNCVFQIWTKKACPFDDMRIRSAPPIVHPDFEMYQYNNTPEALKVFEYPFDFGVPRQGFEDYRRREIRPESMERTKQWALFRTDSHEVKRRLMSLDFERLAMKNTVVPGFGKADVVEEYIKTYYGDAQSLSRHFGSQKGLLTSGDRQQLRGSI